MRTGHPPFFRTKMLLGLISRWSTEEAWTRPRLSVSGIIRARSSFSLRTCPRLERARVIRANATVPKAAAHSHPRSPGSLYHWIRRDRCTTPWWYPFGTRLECALHRRPLWKNQYQTHVTTVSRSVPILAWILILAWTTTSENTVHPQRTRKNLRYGMRTTPRTAECFLCRTLCGNGLLCGNAAAPSE